VRFEERQTLQDTVDEAAPGRDEHEGPIRIDKPLALQGETGVIRALLEPAVRGVPADALLSSNVEVRSPHVTRAVTVGTANAAGPEPASDARLWG
jgi:hypothetical protein